MFKTQLRVVKDTPHTVPRPHGGVVGLYCEYFGETWLNTLRPVQNGHHFADDIFRAIFLNEKSLYFDSDFTEICT